MFLKIHYETIIFFFKVDLFREITFRNSKRSYKGIPVMASNMDTVGTFDMARALSKVSVKKKKIHNKSFLEDDTQ